MTKKDRPQMLNYTFVESFSWTDENRVTDIEMYVPGVNSGAYDKALVVVLRGVRKLKGLFWTRKRDVNLRVVLPLVMVKALRDECNKILELD